MSHAAASASEIGLPNFGVSAAAAALATSVTAANRHRLSRVDMADRSLRVDGPAGDRIDVTHWESGHRRRGARRATLGDQLFPRRLHIARFVGRAALQHDRPAVPLPRHAEAGLRLRQHRVLQRRYSPALTAVSRDLDFGNSSVPGPSDPAYLLEAGSLHLHAR